jgi:hypothetical protein
MPSNFRLAALGVRSHRIVDWSELFIVFLLSHLTGDYLLQTEWQASHKRGGLGADALARRALVSHVALYTLAFVPALVWIADEHGVASAVAAAVAIALPHMVIDDARGLTLYIARVKHVPPPAPPTLFAAVDQSMHLVCLWVVAAVVA